MKVRIAISPGSAPAEPIALAAVVDGLEARGFDRHLIVSALADEAELGAHPGAPMMSEAGGERGQGLGGERDGLFGVGVDQRQQRLGQPG